MKRTVLVLIFFMFPLSLFANCQFSPVVIPDPSPEAISYYRSGNYLWIASQSLKLIVPALIFFSGFAGCLRRFCQKIGRGWFSTTLLFILFFLLILSLVNFPLDFYEGFIRPRTYGLSNQSFGRWLTSFFIDLGVNTALFLIALLILYAIIKKSRRFWWCYCGLLALPLAFLMQVIYPLWINPLFNQFEPMKDPALQAKILHLADRAGIEGSRVYEVNKSVDTKQMNAYVVGIWGAKRIVLWDTTIKGLNEDELLFVMAHEMGHYVLHHIFWAIALDASTIFFLLFLLYFVGGFFLRKMSKQTGVCEFSDPASLALIFFLYPLFSLLCSPALNLYSQKVETEADRFGLEITQDNQGAATGFIKLMETNLSYPWPGKWYTLFRASHPSVGKRILFFNTYHPWCEGKPLQYARYFKPSRDKISPTENK